MIPVYIGYVHDICCVYMVYFCLLILPIINVLIAVLNKHLTPTPEEFHRCKYVCIIMVLPVKGFIEKGFFSGGGFKEKKEGQTFPLLVLLYLTIIHS